MHFVYRTCLFISFKIISNLFDYVYNIYKDIISLLCGYNYLNLQSSYHGLSSNYHQPSLNICHSLCLGSQVHHTTTGVIFLKCRFDQIILKSYLRLLSGIQHPTQSSLYPPLPATFSKSHPSLFYELGNCSLTPFLHLHVVPSVL